MSTAAIREGLVYISETTGHLHCLDAATGQRHWEYDLKAETWSSPLWANGKIYQAVNLGEVFVFEHGRELKFLGTSEFDDDLFGCPAVHEGVLFFATHRHLLALSWRS